jgi:uncharacterized protein with HEPN domain
VQSEVHLFLYDLLNKAVSISDYTAPNDKMTSEQ